MHCLRNIHKLHQKFPYFQLFCSLISMFEKSAKCYIFQNPPHELSTYCAIENQHSPIIVVNWHNPEGKNDVISFATLFSFKVKIVTEWSFQMRYYLPLYLKGLQSYRLSNFETPLGTATFRTSF